LLGWVAGPVLTGDDSTLRLDYFKLLPIPARKLAHAISALVPFVAGKLTDGNSPALADTVRILPSGWGAVAVDAAGRSDWGLVALPLGGLVVLILALMLVWPSLLQRRLMMSSRGRGRTRTHRAAVMKRQILPPTPQGAVIGKELRMYSRSMLRGLFIMISFMVGVLACVIPTLRGSTLLLPFAGLMFTAIAAACFTNMYGDDGSSLWLTLVVPRAARSDVRGRQWAYFLVIGPVGLLLTVVLTAISGQTWGRGVISERAMALLTVSMRDIAPSLTKTLCRWRFTVPR
jgi:ABC-2 type transport system permease protein